MSLDSWTSFVAWNICCSNVEHRKRPIATRSLNRPNLVTFVSFDRSFELPKSINSVWSKLFLICYHEANVNLFLIPNNSIFTDQIKVIFVRNAGQSTCALGWFRFNTKQHIISFYIQMAHVRKMHMFHSIQLIQKRRKAKSIKFLHSGTWRARLTTWVIILHIFFDSGWFPGCFQSRFFDSAWIELMPASVRMIAFCLSLYLPKSSMLSKWYFNKSPPYSVERKKY